VHQVGFHYMDITPLRINREFKLCLNIISWHVPTAGGCSLAADPVGCASDR